MTSARSTSGKSSTASSSRSARCTRSSRATSSAEIEIADDALGRGRGTPTSSTTPSRKRSRGLASSSASTRRTASGGREAGRDEFARGARPRAARFPPRAPGAERVRSRRPVGARGRPGARAREEGRRGGFRLRPGDHRLRRGRPRRGAARGGQGAQDGDHRGRGHRRHLREPRVRAEQGAPVGVRPRARDARRDAPEEPGHPVERQRGVRPAGGLRPRQPAREPHPGLPRQLAHGARRRHPHRLRQAHGPAGGELRAPRARRRRRHHQVQGRHHRDGLHALRAAGHRD